MGRLFTVDLEGDVYTCKHCLTPLALSGHILSKTFRCSHGMAYLFDKVVNISVGKKEEERKLVNGWHVVVDIFCVGCGSLLGWKYVAAKKKAERYKEGKFILERFQVLGPDGSAYMFHHEAQLSGSEDSDDV